MRRLRFMVYRNRRSPDGRLTLAFGIRVGYWPCLRAPFVAIAAGPVSLDFWYGLPSNKTGRFSSKPSKPEPAMMIRNGRKIGHGGLDLGPADPPPPAPLDAKFVGEIRKVKDGSIVPADEFVVFLAKDNAFRATLRFYRHECERLGADAEQLAAVDRMIVRLDHWRAMNPHRLKVPDAKGEKLADSLQPHT